MTVAYDGNVYWLDYTDFWDQAYDFEWEGVKEATLEFQTQHKDTLKLEETFEGKKGILYVSK